MPGQRTAVLLAGGRSVRMGQPKATLRWGAATLLEAVLEPLLATCTKVVVAAHAGQSLPPLPGRVQRVDDPLELDDQGPLVGALCGMRELHPPDRVYFAAADSPWLHREHVELMFARLDALGHEAVLPVQSGRAYPLAAAARVEPARRAATALVEGGTRALKQLFGALDTHHIEVGSLPHPDVVRDCNTPQEYASARRARRFGLLGGSKTTYHR